MQKITAASPESKSPDLAAENLAQLKALFPELVTESKEGVMVNVDVLKSLVGDQTVTDAEEKYGLNWHGKRKARQLALTPSTGTLRPCPEDSVDWDSTQNLMIEGDNLEVLKLLQKSYAGKVKLIYIDPPYNTGKDFVYPDNFKDNIKNYLELTGQTGEGGNKLSSNTEASGRFHTDWLNMMYPRLKLARNLLRDDGAIFISIDGNEVSNLRKMCDEIFGEENFVDSIVWDKKSSAKGVPPRNMMVNVHEYIVAYQKFEHFSFLGEKRNEAKDGFKNPDNDPRGPWRESNIKSTTKSIDEAFTITDPNTGREYTNTWAFSKDSLDRMIGEGRILWKETLPKQKEFMLEMTNENKAIKSSWGVFDPQSTTVSLKNLIPEMHFENPKPLTLMSYLLRVSLEKDSMILDFFAGSATTAHSVMQLNAEDGGVRKFIMVQLPEACDENSEGFRSGYKTIAEFSKERIRRAGKKIREENPLFAGDLGFRVFKLDSTNIREWDPKRDNLAASLEESVEHLKKDRSSDDILYELLLKLGLDLCVPIETKKIGKHEVHNIGAGSLLVCLSSSIPQAEVEPLALGIVGWHKELNPAGESTVVFKDSAFADDVAKTNLAAILQQHGIETVRSL